MKKSQRVFYEVIQENRPCRLYFDLEYSKALNPQVDGEILVREFKDFIIEKIHETFNITITTNDILDLESSNDEKYSRHLIVHTGQYLFASNFQVGEFVKYLIGLIHETRVDMLIKDKENLKVFIDSGVYSKNRNFRLYLSSKLGKNRPLMIASKSGCLPVGIRAVIIDIGTRVRNGRLYNIVTSEDSKKLGLLDPADEFDTELFFMNSLGTFINFMQVSPWPVPSNISLITYKEEHQVPSLKKARTISHIGSEAGFSSFPEYDHLTTLLVQSLTKNPEAKISKSLFFKESNTLVYYFVNDRFCQRIQRPHKSNGVYYILQIDKLQVRQKCFDPDCKFYQSAPFNLQNDENTLDTDYIDDLFVTTLDNFEKENELLS